MKNWFGEYCDHSEPGTTNYTMGETSTYPADKLSESKKSPLPSDRKYKKTFEQYFSLPFCHESTSE